MNENIALNAKQSKILKAATAASPALQYRPSKCYACGWKNNLNESATVVQKTYHCLLQCILEINLPLHYIPTKVPSWDAPISKCDFHVDLVRLPLIYVPFIRAMYRVFSFLRISVLIPPYEYSRAILVSDNRIKNRCTYG